MILNEHISYDNSSILSNTWIIFLQISIIQGSWRAYLEVTPSCVNFHTVMCRRRFVIQEIIITILLHGGGRRSHVGAVVGTGSTGVGCWTIWARGLTVPWHSQTISRRGLTASLYVSAVRDSGQTDLIFGLAVYFLCSGGLTARRRNRTAGS
jgi:hypothetical protein